MDPIEVKRLVNIYKAHPNYFNEDQTADLEQLARIYPLHNLSLGQFGPWLLLSLGAILVTSLVIWRGR